MGLLEKYHIAGDAESLDSAAAAHREMASLITQASRQVRNTPLEDWTGAAAEAASAKRRKLADAMDQTATAMSTVATGHGELAKKIRSTRNKIEGLVAGAVAAAAVGILLTWATAGLLASATVVVTELIAECVGLAIAGLATETIATIGTWVVFNSVIGIVEGITFTGVDHEVEGTAWTPDDAAQVFTIAAGSLVGRGASVGAGRAIGAVFGAADSTSAKVGQGALAGAIGGATTGTINPIAVPIARGVPIDWSMVGYSAAVNGVLGGVGGGIIGGTGLGGTAGRVSNLSNSIKTIAGRPISTVNTVTEIEMVPIRSVPGGDAGGGGAAEGGVSTEDLAMSTAGSGDDESLYFDADSDGSGTVAYTDDDVDAVTGGAAGSDSGSDGGYETATSDLPVDTDPNPATS